MNSISYNSKSYFKFDWLEIIKESYSRLANGRSPSVISNQNVFLFPLGFSDAKKITIIFKNEMIKLEINKLEWIENHFMQSCNIKVGKIPSQFLKEKVKTGENPYFMVCYDICKTILKQVFKIFEYSHDHLKERYSEGSKLINHESIRFSFANILCNLECSKTILIKASQLSELGVCIDYLLTALRILAEVNGGRAILRGNAIEAIFHLYVFNTIFLKV